MCHSECVTQHLITSPMSICAEQKRTVKPNQAIKWNVIDFDKQRLSPKNKYALFAYYNTKLILMDKLSKILKSNTYVAMHTARMIVSISINGKSWLLIQSIFRIQLKWNRNIHNSIEQIDKHGCHRIIWVGQIPNIFYHQKQCVYT